MKNYRFIVKFANDWGVIEYQIVKVEAEDVIQARSIARDYAIWSRSSWYGVVIEPEPDVKLSRGSVDKLINDKRKEDR